MLPRLTDRTGYLGLSAFFWFNFWYQQVQKHGR